jgi:superfamily I DNA/RNA helicase
MIDEAQDLNRAQLELVLRAVGPGGRTLAVGDAGQAIYGWAGADYTSMERIAERTQARALPLSICYRCPASHVALAQSIHPQIEARPDAPEGDIWSEVPEPDMLDRLRPGDLVICRTNAPLVALTYALIRRGVQARMRGRDIGRGLAALVRRIANQEDCTLADFPERVERWREQQEEALLAKGKVGLEQALINLRDRAETVVAVYDSQKPASLVDFVRRVEELFRDKDEARAVVWLSSIHRAKGDEAEHVYVARPDLLPHPKASAPQDMEQEQNLRYVAFTRAKAALYFVERPAPPQARARPWRG